MRGAPARSKRNSGSSSGGGSRSSTKRSTCAVRIYRAPHQAVKELARGDAEARNWRNTVFLPRAATAERGKWCEAPAGAIGWPSRFLPLPPSRSPPPPRFARGRKAPRLRGSACISISLDFRLRLLDEGAVGAAEIFRLHAERLRLSFRLERIVDAHRPFAVQHLFGHGVRKCGAAGKLVRRARRFGEQGFCGDDAIIEPPAVAFFRAHRASGEKQFGGAAMTDQARQDRAGAHVTA